MKPAELGDFEVSGGPSLCACGRPQIRTVMGKQGEWYVGRWCGCDDSGSPRFPTYAEAEAELHK